MTRAVPMVAEISLVRVVLRQGDWSVAMAPGAVGQWLALYRRLRDRGAVAGRAGPWAGYYAANVGVLEAVVRAVARGFVGDVRG